MADDLLLGLKDAVAKNDPDNRIGEDPEAVLQEFMKVLENMPGLSDEDRAALAENLMQGGMDGPGGSESPLGGPMVSPWVECLILLVLIGFIVLFLGFVGFKLYSAIIDRERRKELKKLQKDQRKKK